MKIINALSEGNLILEKNLIKTARLDTEILMSNVINKDRKYIILNSNKKLVPDLYNSFMDLIKQRSKGKPVAYLVRKKDFWKYQFQLNENTLIPRPDTELIIENFLKITKFKSRLKILDIGVGSGCILLSILKEKKDFYGTGIDISKKCINIANLNALNLGLLNRTKIVKSDIDNFNYGKYDVIISNPPYIKKFSLKYLDRDVVNFEPKQALDGGVEGTSEIRKVINKSSELIKKNGKLILEIGFDQKNKTKKLLTNKGFYINKIIKDYANNDRCIISTKI
tara:strand:- start:1829 stop:2671 length:843 start_codon:yes stop_codon:yes gene_type:complete